MLATCREVYRHNVPQSLEEIHTGYAFSRLLEDSCRDVAGTGADFEDCICGLQLCLVDTAIKDAVSVLEALPTRRHVMSTYIAEREGQHMMSPKNDTLLHTQV